MPMHAEWLDANVEPSRPKSGVAVAKKIALDQLLYAPVFTVGLYVYLALANGDYNSIPDIVQVCCCSASAHDLTRHVHWHTAMQCMH